MTGGPTRSAEIELISLTPSQHNHEVVVSQVQATLANTEGENKSVAGARQKLLIMNAFCTYGLCMSIISKHPVSSTDVRMFSAATYPATGVDEVSAEVPPKASIGMSFALSGVGGQETVIVELVYVPEVQRDE